MTLLTSMFLYGSHDQNYSCTCCSGEVAVLIYNSNDTSNLIDARINCGLQWHHLPDLGEDGNIYA